MASLIMPRDGLVVKVFLVVVSFLLTPATSIAVDVSLKLRLRHEPPVYRRPSDIFSRDDSSCPLEDYTQCGSRLPGNMCCPNDSECMVIASNTTVVCCPKGVSCRRIEPIVCNIALQDPVKYPKSPIKTVALNKSMPRCGSTCCPFGYLCDNDECVLDDNQTQYSFLLPKSSTQQSSTPTPTPTSATELVMETSKLPTTIAPRPTAATTTAAGTFSTDTNDGDNSEEKSSGGISPAGVVTAGTVGGVCCAAGLGIFIWLKWFRKRPGSPQSTPSAESWAHFTPSGTTRQVQLTRGPNDKFVITPSTGAFSPLPTPYYESRREDASPVELPATPVSMSMWMNLENAAVEEPRLAYVLPPRPVNR